MLTRDLLDVSPSPLRLFLHPQRLRVNAHNPYPALEQPFIDIRRPLEREIARTEDRRAVKAQNVAGLHVRHKEGETQMVSFRYEVGPVMQVRGYVVWFLVGEVRQCLEEGFCHG